MKRKKLVRQFQIHMLFTMAILALISAFSYSKIIEYQNLILPDKKVAYVDITSTYADGTSSTETCKVNMDRGSEPTKYEKKNELSEGGDKGTEKLTVEIAGSDSLAIIDKSEFQTGTTVSISSIKDGFSMLSEEEQNQYNMLEKLKYILPLLCFIIGILLSCYGFYILHMKQPVAEMEKAAEKISNNNLDFNISSGAKNELGRLCDSFEHMRISLVHNNREMLKLMDDKKKIQASVAHDLRNPIAIMKGYLEMMDDDIRSRSFSADTISDSVNTLTKTVNRMEQYVESMNYLNHLEELELAPTEALAENCISLWEKDLVILGKQQGIDVIFNSQINNNPLIKVDSPAVLRILENIIENSCRYAKEKVFITISLVDNSQLCIDIIDDGPGYPKKIIDNAEVYFFTTEKNSGHTGMGMTICRILCSKHGGSIRFTNSENGGARAIIRLNVDSNLTS